MEVQLIQVNSPTFHALIEAAAKAGAEAVIKLMKVKSVDAEWVGTQQAREILGCGASKLQILRDQKAITFTGGPRPRYKVESLKQYLENKSK